MPSTVCVLRSSWTITKSYRTRNASTREVQTALSLISPHPQRTITLHHATTPSQPRARANHTNARCGTARAPSVRASSVRASERPSSSVPTRSAQHRRLRRRPSQAPNRRGDCTDATPNTRADDRADAHPENRADDRADAPLNTRADDCTDVLTWDHVTIHVTIHVTDVSKTGLQHSWANGKWHMANGRRQMTANDGK